MLEDISYQVCRKNMEAFYHGKFQTCRSLPDPLPRPRRQDRPRPLQGFPERGRDLRRRGLHAVRGAGLRPAAEVLLTFGFYAVSPLHIRREISQERKTTFVLAEICLNIQENFYAFLKKDL